MNSIARAVPATPPASAAPGPVRAGASHIPALDGVRGVAILMVSVFHFIDMSHTSSRMWNTFTHVVGFGQTGVDLFFALSGFLITGILWDAKQNAHYFRNFYARRVLRIFPLYYGMLILVGLLGHHHSLILPRLPTGSDGVRYWLYLSNFAEGDGRFVGHFWSLAIEEQFYLVWPLVVWLCSERQLKVICVLAFIEAFCARWYSARYVNTAACYYFTYCRIDSLTAGAFVATMARNSAGLARLRRWSLPVCIVVGLATAALWLVIPKGEGGWGIVIKHSFLAILFGSIIAMVGAVKSPGVLVKILSMRWLRLFGKYSYGIYVYDGLFIAVLGYYLGPALFERWFHSHALGQFAHCLIAVGLTLGVAFVSWHLYEKQFLKLKKYFEYRPQVSKPELAAADRRAF